MLLLTLSPSDFNVDGKTDLAVGTSGSGACHGHTAPMTTGYGFIFWVPIGLVPLPGLLDCGFVRRGTGGDAQSWASARSDSADHCFGFAVIRRLRRRWFVSTCEPGNGRGNVHGRRDRNFEQLERLNHNESLTVAVY